MKARSIKRPRKMPEMENKRRRSRLRIWALMSTSSRPHMASLKMGRARGTRCIAAHVRWGILKIEQKKESQRDGGGRRMKTIW